MFYNAKHPRGRGETGRARMSNDTVMRSQEASRWRRWLSYALGILIETAAVLVISGLALLVIILVKVIMK